MSASQSQTQPISFVEEIYNMRSPQDLTKFLFEFYNYAHYVKGDAFEGVDGEGLNYAIKARNLESLTHKKTTSTEWERNEDPSSSGRTSNSNSGKQRAAELASDFDKVGYKTQPENYGGEGFSRLKPVCVCQGLVPAIGLTVWYSYQIT